MSRVLKEFAPRHLSGGSFARVLIFAFGVGVVAFLLLRSGSTGLGLVLGAGALGIAGWANSMREAKQPPLVLLDDAIQFKDKKIYFRDVTEISGRPGSGYFDVEILTGHGKHSFNLLEYSVAETSADMFVDILRDAWKAARAA